jgi:hypothetical protein
VNEGTFGVVFKAIKASEKANYDECMARGTVFLNFYAIKKPKNNAREGEGFNKDAVREIALLMELKRGTGVDALVFAAAERARLALPPAHKWRAGSWAVLRARFACICKTCTWRPEICTWRSG